MNDWTFDNIDSAMTIRQEVVRFDDVRLVLYIRQDEAGWGVRAIETTGAGDATRQFICRITHRSTLTDAIAAGEAFARRWLDGAPGTAVATYVEKPRVPS